MSEQWRFDQDDQARWRWKLVNEAQEEQVDSQDTFTTQIDCIMDAVRFAVRRRRARSDDGRTISPD